MSQYYYKLTKSEAEALCKKVGVSLPKKKKRAIYPMPKNITKGSMKFYEVEKRYLNQSKTIRIQPCHFDGGTAGGHFTYEIQHSTTESAFSRFMNKYHVPVRVWTY